MTPERFFEITAVAPRAPARLIARLALAIPRLERRQRAAWRRLQRYCERYGATGSPAHRRRIDDYIRADSARCRAESRILDAARADGHSARKRLFVPARLP